MQLLKLKINDQTYMSGKITTYMTKEALKIHRDALELRDKALGGTDGQSPEEAAAELLDAVCDITDRKVWLLCEVYGNKFTTDEVEMNLSTEEIDQALNMIISGVSGVIEKNSQRGPRKAAAPPSTKKR